MTKPGQKVFIVDDDASFLKSLERLLRSSGYVTECFNSASELLARTPGATGCVLADLRMPGMDGLDLQATLAQSADPLPVVFLTGDGDISASVEAMRKGAEDFLVKTTPKQLLIAAIDRALARNARERRARTRYQQLQSRFEKLTPREHQVLSQVMLGRMNKQIAADLGIDERSVKRHRTNMMRKLGVTSIAELVQLAIEAGMPGAE
jgi:two-component system response regulator FixJ